MAKFYILTIDGGGVRGVIPAIWLKEICEQAEAEAHEIFDLVVGTSGGAIVGAFAALGHDLKNATTLYDDHGQTIFPDAVIKYGALGRWTKIVETWAKLVQPAYKERDLSVALRKIFGGADLSACKTNFMATSYDTESRVITLLKSFDPLQANIKVWEAVKSSSSAPTYFPAHILGNGADSKPLIDGGVFANNPSMLALATAINDFNVPLDEVIIVSLGSGNMRRPIKRSQARKWGAAQWVRPLLDVIFDSTSEMNDRCARAMMFDENYARMQVQLIGVRDDLDAADSTNLRLLRGTASAYLVHEGMDTYEKIMRMLAPRIDEIKHRRAQTALSPANSMLPIA